VSSVEAVHLGQEAVMAMDSDQHEDKSLYDVANSPYIDLESPFTLW
jgi:hypothetical protein